MRSHTSHDHHVILPVTNKDWNNCLVAWDWEIGTSPFWTKWVLIHFTINSLGEIPLFWFIFPNSALLPLLMLQPALTPALCSIRQHQMSCVEISDLRFRSHLYCISMIFAFLGLPACPSTPSTAIQPLRHRVTAQRGPQISQQLERGPPIYSMWTIAHCGHPVLVSTCTKARQSESDLRPDLLSSPRCLWRYADIADAYTDRNLLSVPICSHRKGKGCQQHARQSLLSSSPASLTSYKGRLLFKN